MRDPTTAAHLLGKLLTHVGQDNVLWGTDSIWYGSPQDQIQAFRSFQIAPELIEAHGYPVLTPALKAKVFGLNGARVYGDRRARAAAEDRGRSDRPQEGGLSRSRRRPDLRDLRAAGPIASSRRCSPSARACRPDGRGARARTVSHRSWRTLGVAIALAAAGALALAGPGHRSGPWQFGTDFVILRYAVHGGIAAREIRQRGIDDRPDAPAADGPAAPAADSS